MLSVLVSSSSRIAGAATLASRRLNVLGISQVDRCGPRLLRLERSSLSKTTWNRIELSAVEQVLEVSPRREDDVHRLDVRRREVLQLVCPIAA